MFLRRKKPGAHVAHTPSLTVVKPPLHVHVLLATGASLCNGHDTHTSSTALEYWPSAQLLQLLEADASVYVPAAQRKQVKGAMSVMYVPALQ